MGAFYVPVAQPPTASSAGTLPLPHDPIPPQGQQPPRRQSAAIVAMAIVLASWPGDLEPRLQLPNNRQQTVATVTLPTGQSPPRRTWASLMATTLVSWPSDLEPRLLWPNTHQQTIAPLTYIYGQPPYVIPFRADSDAVVLFAESDTAVTLTAESDASPSLLANLDAL